jgi:hypothetical protein
MSKNKTAVPRELFTKAVLHVVSKKEKILEGNYRLWLNVACSKC